MLYKETVESTTLELLNSLQSKSYLAGFYLVGGTALSLRIGHRKSADLDLFSNFSFDVVQLMENLTADYSFNLFFSANNTIKGSIDNVKVDLLSHRYPLINKPVVEEKIELLSTQDLIAMKLNAISGSGQRVKDFIDIYYLLQNFSIDQMIGFYKKKYSYYNEVSVLKSLVYFDDIDFNDWPEMIADPDLKWNTIKDELEKRVKKYLNQQIMR